MRNLPRQTAAFVIVPFIIFFSARRGCDCNVCLQPLHYFSKILKKKQEKKTDDQRERKTGNVTSCAREAKALLADGLLPSRARSRLIFLLALQTIAELYVRAHMSEILLKFNEPIN